MHLPIAFTVFLTDVLLAGDNVVAVSLTAACLGDARRRDAMFFGIGFAIAVRAILSLVTVDLLRTPELLLAGGVLLVWISSKLWKEVSAKADGGPAGASSVCRSGFWCVIVRVAIADLSMSLDNVLAIAGVSFNHPRSLVLGLMLSIVIMLVASHYLVVLFDRHRWLAYGGVISILWVAVDMLSVGLGGTVAALSSAAFPHMGVGGL